MHLERRPRPAAGSSALGASTKAALNSLKERIKLSPDCLAGATRTISEVILAKIGRQVLSGAVGGLNLIHILVHIFALKSKTSFFLFVICQEISFLEINKIRKGREQF